MQDSLAEDQHNHVLAVMENTVARVLQGEVLCLLGKKHVESCVVGDGQVQVGIELRELGWHVNDGDRPEP